MNRSTKIAVVIAAVVGVVVVVVVAPAFRPSSNCGGNSAALSACQAYVTMAVVHSMNEPNGFFNIDRLTADDRALLRNLPGRNWLRTANFLVRVGEVKASKDSGSRKIIIVCDRPYDNVPRRFLGKAPLSHAVGYSTGEAGLITVQEFAQLDHKMFTDLDRLLSD